LLLCAAEVLGLAGLATFASLLPFFMQAWSLTNTQAGWLSAIYYAAYVVMVPILTAVTDRRDARNVLLISLLVGALASLGFAWGAQGFWSALVLRFLAGVSLAGIYMPGLKLLSDHTEGPGQSRYVSFYTASFSLGTSLSYFMAGEVYAALDWYWAFGAAGLLTMAGALLVWLWVPAGRTPAPDTPGARQTTLGAVLRNRHAMVFILAYAAHMWELFSMRSWMVAFLDYSRRLQPAGIFDWSPIQVVALINLIGLPASIGGNELCRRFGRKKVLVRIMAVSALMSLGIGFAASLPYAVVVALGLLYGVFVLGDSASLTAGAVANAPPGGRGATLAVHSTLGFGAAFLGPLATGIIMDFLQGNTGLAWGAAFISMGAGCALGPLALTLLREEKSVRS
jgi:MFS family permease